MMQTTVEQLKAQQLILKAKGFYTGLIDGKWGPMSIEAMKKFERVPAFKPGLPNNGLPMKNHAPYPSGVYKLPNGCLTSSDAEAFEAKNAAPKSMTMAEVQQQGNANKHKPGNQQNSNQAVQPEVEEKPEE